MAPNRKKVLVPSNMGKQGVDILRARDDIELVVYPVAITHEDLHPMLGDANAIALSATPFKAAQSAASPALQVVARIGVGFDAVEIPPLSARKMIRVFGQFWRMCATMRATSISAPALPATLASRCRASSRCRPQNI